MSLVLTSVATRPVVIDLTKTSSSPPSSSNRFTFTNARPPPQPLLLPVMREEGPPAKRRRVGSDWAKRQNIACQQVSPYVNRAVVDLSRRQYMIDEIAIQAISTFAKDTKFLSRLDEKKGFSLPTNDAWTTVRAKEIVRELVVQPKYQIHPAKTAENKFKTKQPDPHSRLSGATAAPVRPFATAPQPFTSTPYRQQGCSGRHDRPWEGSSDLPASSSSWFNLEKRPYQSATNRELIAKGARYPLRLSGSVRGPIVYHVDFTSDEIAEITSIVSKYQPECIPATIECLTRACHSYHVPTLVGDAIRHRTVEDVRNFCSDLLAGTATPPNQGRILQLDQDSDASQDSRRASRVASLLLARETVGNRGFGYTRHYTNFQNEFTKTHEDAMALIAEFTNCAGDIATTTWVPDNNVICGTTVHSDTHNQQYNKPGNLLLCSTTLGQLRAFPDHRIPRPLVEKGENSTEAMRQSQDPWLYSSVVSSDYDKVHGLAYTSSFDKSVKVWKINTSGTSMTALDTWHLDGNVNFVAAAMDGSGRVAAAADVPTEAVRIYTVNKNGVANSPYQSFSCSRTDADGSGKWAYFPATMQWGRGSGTQHLLAVGYSPRGLAGDDHDIPEDKRNSGEITLWDAANGCRVPVLTATTANFFEVVWHPILPRFIAATSPCGLKVAPGVRTQIHLFGLQDGSYSEYHNLDCFASDINELTLMPNSLGHAYVTAGCTDGNIYVWDTARGDKPIHVLKHGRPLDEYYEDREREDTGVKFTAWGKSLDRFYTGASDGVVKVWNVRNWRNPHVRDLLEAPGPISCGAFSPDLTRLVIGDATGRVFVFSLDKRDEPEAHFMTIQGLDRKIRRPTPFIPHAEPPPPDHDPDRMEDDDLEPPIAAISRETYLDTGQLILHPNPVIGAVQGPEYGSTGLFRREAHLGDDPAGPLLTLYERQQRESILASRGIRSRSIRRLKQIGEPGVQLQNCHAINKAQDLDVDSLAAEELAELIRAGAQLSIAEEDWGLNYEEMPANTLEANGSHTI